MLIAFIHILENISLNLWKFSYGNTLKRDKQFLIHFAGSGTTLVQANELGMKSIGYDISGFNVLLTQAKTTNYNIPEARREILDILDKVKAATQIDSKQKKLWIE